MELWQILLLGYVGVAFLVAIGFGCYARGRSDWQIPCKRQGVMKA